MDSQASHELAASQQPSSSASLDLFVDSSDSEETLRLRGTTRSRFAGRFKKKPRIPLSMLRKLGEPDASKRRNRFGNDIEEVQKNFRLFCSAEDSVPKSSNHLQQRETSPPPSSDTSDDSPKVPVLPHYELKNISAQNRLDNDNAGNNAGVDDEYGLFATRRIEEGTRIICEAPLITLPFPGNQIEDLRRAYDELSRKDKMRIWDLKPCAQGASDQLTDLGNAVRPFVIAVAAILEKSEKDRTEEEKADLESMGPKLERTLETLRLAARWHANQTSLINLPEHERFNLLPGTPVSGLFIETAKLRHSCVPNCYVAYNRATDQITVHVTRTLEPGQELTASSIADMMYYQTSDKRQERLQDEFSITCTCEACDASHPNFPKHENARTQAFGRATILADFCTRLEMVDFDSVRKDLHIATPSSEMQGQTQEQLIMAEELILALCENLRATQCNTIEHARWRNALIDRIQPKLAELESGAERLRIWKVIAAHAKTCEVVTRKCYGVDHEDTQKATARKEKIIAAVKRAQEHAKSLEKSRKSIQ